MTKEVKKCGKCKLYQPSPSLTKAAAGNLSKGETRGFRGCKGITRNYLLTRSTIRCISPTEYMPLTKIKQSTVIRRRVRITIPTVVKTRLAAPTTKKADFRHVDDCQTCLNTFDAYLENTRRSDTGEPLPPNKIVRMPDCGVSFFDISLHGGTCLRPDKRQKLTD